MKKNMLLFFQILVAIIILLLALSTFYIQQKNPEFYSNNWFTRLLCLDHFYDSLLNFALFSIMIILIVVAIFVKRLKVKGQMILHIIISLAFLIIIFDKYSNFRIMMPILEGETIEFGKVIGDDNYTQKISLH